VREAGGLGRASQVQLDATDHVVEVGAPLPQIGVAKAAEELVELLRDRPQRPLRVDPLLAHDPDGPLAQEGVVEHQEVGVEDVGVGSPDLAGQTVLDRP
jgi:hypothetical protein